MKQHWLGFLYLVLGGMFLLVAVGLESQVGLSISVIILVCSLLYFVFSVMKKQEELAHQLEIQRKWGILLHYKKLAAKDSAFIVINLSNAPLSWPKSQLEGLGNAYYLQLGDWLIGEPHIESLKQGDVVVIWSITKDSNIFESLNSQLRGTYPMLGYFDVRPLTHDYHRGVAMGIVSI